MNTWISVKERLPEKNGEYLAYYHNGLLEMRIGVVDYQWVDDKFAREACPKEGGYPHWYDYADETIVTHWMPLPEPPKEEKN